MTSRGISQTSDSVTCIPNYQLKKAINLIEEGKLAKQEIGMLNQKIVLLVSKIDLRDSVIASFRKKEENFNRIFHNQEQMHLNDSQIIMNLQKNVSLKQSLLNRQKFKKWVTLAVGFGFGYIVFHH